MQIPPIPPSNLTHLGNVPNSDPKYSLVSNITLLQAFLVQQPSMTDGNTLSEYSQLQAKIFTSIHNAGLDSDLTISEYMVTASDALFPLSWATCGLQQVSKRLGGYTKSCHRSNTLKNRQNG